MKSSNKPARNTKRAKKTKTAQTRNTVLRTLSFDTEVFQAMEDKRAQLGLSRSQFVGQLINSHIVLNSPLYNGALPAHLVPERLKKQAEKAAKITSEMNSR